MKEIIYATYIAGLVSGVVLTRIYKHLDKVNQSIAKTFYQSLTKQQRTLFYDSIKYNDMVKECRAIELMADDQRRMYHNMTLNQKRIFKDLVINYETAYFDA